MIVRSAVVGTDDLTNIRRLHSDGLSRVSRIVDGIPTYDDILRHKLTDSDLALFADNVDISEKRRRAISAFERKMKRFSYKVIQPTFAGLTCDGTSSNNLREFAFFERICANIAPDLSSRNYGRCESYRFSSLTSFHRNARETIIDDVHEFYRLRQTVTPSLVRRQIIYSLSFFNFLIAFLSKDAVKPAALIQANDHSPSRVALSMIMKGLRVPRVYLQHAEVTQHFPPLDFEFSVLRNEQSRDTYEAIGPLPGQVYVIPRYEDVFAREKLTKERGKGMTVVIYPTSRASLNPLQDIVNRLSANAAVDRLLIKLHPGAALPLNELVDAPASTFANDIPNEDHVALVGNSSVAVELLHRGIPVYQNFDFDPVQPDYYGLVKSGLTFRVSQQELSGVFWRPYRLDDAWLETYARWDPTVDTAYLDEQAGFCIEMARLIREWKESRPEAQNTAFLVDRHGENPPRLDRITKRIRTALRNLLQPDGGVDGR